MTTPLASLDAMQEEKTKEQATTILLESLQKSTNSLAAAIRRKAQGHEVNFLHERQAVMEKIDQVVQQVSPLAVTHPTMLSPEELMASYWERQEKRKALAGTGFARLNQALSGGLDAGCIYVLMGPPGSGKTTLANQIAHHLASEQRPVLYITSEDAPHTLLAKTLARLGQIDYAAVRFGWKDQAEQINAAMRAYRQTESMRFLRYVDATRGITLDEIAELASQHFGQLAGEASGAPVIIHDYLQRLAKHEALGNNPYEHVGHYIGQLRAMTADLGCSTMTLSSMGRASYNGGNPLAGAKESGDVEYEADTVMSIGPDGEQPGIGPGFRNWKLAIAKNRQGENDQAILLDWFGAHQRFSEKDLDSETVAAPNSGRGRGKRA